MKKVWIAFLTVGLVLINLAIFLTYQNKEMYTYLYGNTSVEGKKKRNKKQT